MVKNLAVAVGRRKTSIARVYLRKGSGNIIINRRKFEKYFPIEEYQIYVKQPLAVTDSLNKFDILVNLRGGGLSGQAGACRHGIARVLTAYDESNKPALRANGFLTRDARMVERKKYGQRGARRKFQFSKR
ncbi:MAG: 30S ribosomal protein S9 [Spirochaetes bacterium]|nr:MAG: 30S ribosomal protein S9 [Spirochaetota bacterium]